ncbi:MAG: glycoside hydrolase [Sarcina sp.]
MSMLTMPFFAVNKKDYSIMYIMNNPLNNNISFNTSQNITFNVNHQFTSINPDKTFSYRMYVTPNNSVNIAKTFKDYIVSKGQFTTLKQKEEKNPNVAKLIGAPEIYLWDSVVIQENNIRWRLLGKDMKAPLKNWLVKLLNENSSTQGYAQSFADLKPHHFVDKFDKENIINGITSLCQDRNLYNPKIFTKTTPQIQALLGKGINNLTSSQVIQLNKMLLKEELGNSLAPVSAWSSASTTDMINDMKQSGINKLWIGLSDWTYAYMKPSLASDANNLGYLIAPYDSYNMVEKQGDINSNTASFPGTNLYNNGVIENKNGQIVSGFHNQGRTLNPTLVFPEVKARVAKVLKNIPFFNSWFMDCDAAGQIYNDYTPSHTTTKEQDLQARINRMAYVANDEHMVVGSERGDSYASQVIDFAQGLESQPFSWMEQGAKDKNSPYYTGSYYAPLGGVPSKFGKQVPVRPWIEQCIMSPVYTVPLYKMVYNNSVITTNHWLWGTFKVKGIVKQRYLHDFLYNVPALYHLDATAWANQKSTILAHNKVWAPFSERVTNELMTDFKILSKDRLVQMTEYGNNTKVIANFSDKTVVEEGVTIKPQSLVIFEGNKKIYYTPQLLSNDL